MTYDWSMKTVLYFYDNSFAMVLALQGTGAGKSTIIDSVMLRCLRQLPSGLTVIFK